MLNIRDLPWQTSPGPKPVENERVLCVQHQHWMNDAPLFALCLAFGLIGLVCIALGALLVDGVRIAVVITGFFLLHCAAHTFFHHLLSATLGQQLLITNERLLQFEDRLWLETGMQEVALRSIKSVEAHKQGMLANIFGYGTLQLNTSAKGSAGISIPYVPHPHAAAQIIMSQLPLL